MTIPDLPPEQIASATKEVAAAIKGLRKLHKRLKEKSNG